MGARAQSVALGVESPNGWGSRPAGCAGIARRGLNRNLFLLGLRRPRARTIITLFRGVLIRHRVCPGVRLNERPLRIREGVSRVVMRAASSMQSVIEPANLTRTVLHG